MNYQRENFTIPYFHSKPTRLRSGTDQAPTRHRPGTIPSQQLQEIVIEAPKVVRKADMDVYHPSRSAVEHSRNGMQLLNNLMIPSLSVNDALGSISAAGESVQVRINGRPSSIDNVRALLPESIKRVEWIDNPGLRYGGANYVVNFIVANPTVGGSLQLSAMPALNVAWGKYMADAKFNFGKSQFEFLSRRQIIKSRGVVWLHGFCHVYQRLRYPRKSSIYCANALRPVSVTLHVVLGFLPTNCFSMSM